MTGKGTGKKTEAWCGAGGPSAGRELEGETKRQCSFLSNYHPRTSTWLPEWERYSWRLWVPDQG